MAKVDFDGDGRPDISISIPSIVGSYYTLNARLDAVELAAKKLKENEQKYTWPAQRELESQFRAQEIKLNNFMKDLEYLQKDKKR